jgi:hypothetical protein
MGQRMSNRNDEPTDVGGILTVFVQRFMLFAGGLACIVSMSRFSLNLFASGGVLGIVFGLMLAGVALLGVWIVFLAFMPWQRGTEATLDHDDAVPPDHRTCGYCLRRAGRADVQCASCGANLR